MNIPFVHQRLANGLDVIVHEDRDCPIVAVNVWYHVGSKNEQPGRTGFAHLFEHLMFEGSEHHDAGYFRAAPGGRRPSSTDRPTPTGPTTGKSCPPNAVELALWMESDRMGYLLPALTEAKFENQRNVVLNERRQNYENRPYGFAGMSLVAALYPPDHPYHWMTIGAAEDLKAARLDDVPGVLPDLLPSAERVAGDRRRHRRRPGGRAGDRLLRRSRRGSGASAGRGAHGGRSPARRDSSSKTASSCRGSTSPGIRRRSSPRTTPSWIWCPRCSPAARRRRLYRSLVYEQRIATEIAASQGSRELGQLLSDRRDCGAGTIAGRGRTGDRHRAGAVPREGSVRRRDGAVPGAGRGALPASPADRRRLRR